MSIKIESFKSKKLIGQVFLERGLIDEEELRTALNLQLESREKLGKLLVDLGYVSERDCLAIVSEHLGIPAVSAADLSTGSGNRKCPHFPVHEAVQVCPCRIAERMCSRWP